MLPLLEIKNLTIDFITETGETRAVSDLTFTVSRNEITGIAGESGSGKSITSLSILRLLASPPARYVSGQILYSPDGIGAVDLLTLESASLRALRGRQIAMIFQEPMTSLNPVFTCGEQVIEAIVLHEGGSRDEARDKTLALFRRVHLQDPEGVLGRYPHQLSGGQKQRVMIAMAISCSPSLLICDEPTTALDVTVQQSILNLIRELQGQYGMGVIFITHDLGVLAAIAGKVVIMEKGIIVEQGPLRQVFMSPVHAYTKKLLASRPQLADRIDHGDVLLKVRDLSVTFPAATRKSLPLKAVDHVSFDVYRGETLGLVGESGCGKTTLGRTLLRLIDPDSGSVFYAGTDLLALRGRDLRKFRKNVQLIFQDPYASLNPSMTIGAALSEPLVVHYPELDNRARKRRVIELLDKVNLPESFYDRFPHELSGGQRQRVVIARALMPEPSFIVCDESVSALDLTVQAQVLELLQSLRKELGFTVVFISHDLSVVRAICDRVMVMYAGQIIEAGPAEQIYLQPQSDYTKKLLAAIPQSFLPSPA